MSDKEIEPKDNKNDFTKKPKQEETEQDNEEKKQNQEASKPMRFQFGHDTTDEDIERFLDKILGPDPEKNNDK
mgnify:CR=1 FL=1